MGAMFSNPLQYLIENYGPDVCKYFVAIKSQQFLDQTTPKFTEKVQQQIKNTASSLDKEFDIRQSAIKGSYDSTIADIKSSNPAALEAVVKSQGKKEQQILGFNSIQSKFNELKSFKDQKLKQQEGNLMGLIQNKKQELKKSILANKPSLPLLDEMPICLKQKVLSEGQAKFAPQIKEKQEQITGLFEKVTNLGNLEKDIKTASGLGEVDKLVKDSQSAFQKAKKMITFTANPKSCFG